MARERLSLAKRSKRAFAISSSPFFSLSVASASLTARCFRRPSRSCPKSMDLTAAAHELSALRIRLGLRARPVSFRADCLTALDPSASTASPSSAGRFAPFSPHSPATSPPAPHLPPSSFFACSPASSSRRSFPATAASSLPGFLLPSAAAPPQSSIRRNISRCRFSRPSSDG